MKRASAKGRNSFCERTEGSPNLAGVLGYALVLNYAPKVEPET